MKKTTANFATITRNGIIEKIGKSYIPHPEIRFSGGTIKWYEDKLKTQPKSTEERR